MGSEEFFKEATKGWNKKEPMPYIIKIPIKVFYFIRYRVFCMDWVNDIKYKYQSITKGHSDLDIWNLNDFIVRKIRAPFKEFVRYQEQQGHGLPIKFQSDPAAWLVVLSKIEYSIEHTWKENNEPDYDFTDNMTPEQVKEHHEKIEEGFMLFGEFLLDLWD